MSSAQQQGLLGHSTLLCVRPRRSRVGTVNGWERVLMFKPMADFEETATYRFNESHAIVALEIAALQKDVGVMEVSGFNRYELKGEGVEEWLDHLACGGIPKEVGQVRLCYLLNRNGRMLCEATLAKLADNHFWYGSAAAAEWHDRDYLWASMPATVSLTEMASSHTILVWRVLNRVIYCSHYRLVVIGVHKPLVGCRFDV